MITVKNRTVQITNATRHKTQIMMSMLHCSLAPTFAPDVVPGLLALCEPERLPIDPLALVVDGGAAAARLLTEAHVAAAFVLVLPSR